MFIFKQNWRSVLRSKININHVIFTSPDQAAPPVMVFMRSNRSVLNPQGTTIFVENKYRNVRAFQNTAELDELLSNAALFVSGKNEFYNRDMMRGVHTFQFLFDLNSKYFMLMNIQRSRPESALAGGFSILHNYEYIKTKPEHFITGMLFLEDNGEFRSAIARPYNFRSGNIISTETLFNTLSGSLERLGCAKRVSLYNNTPHDDSMLVRDKNKKYL
jgi:hypothetical protein